MESHILLVTPCRHLHLAALNFWLLKKGSIKFHPTSGSDRRCSWLHWTSGSDRRDASGCTGHLEVITEMQLVALDFWR